MRLLLPLALLFALCCWFSGCSTPASTTENTPAKTTGSADSDMPFPKLEVGMTSAVIRQKLGAPAEVQPTPSPEGKAEVWIYKYEKDLGTTQVATGTRDVQVMSMGQSSSGTSTVQEPTYSNVTKKSEITLSLLMFNDKLQAQKAAVVERLDHN
jgi:hypothetical protein